MFRDDTEAALARARAAEVEAENLKRELAEVREENRRLRQPPIPDSDQQGERASTRGNKKRFQFKTLIFPGLILAFVASTAGGEYFCNMRRARSGAARLHRADLIRDAQGQQRLLTLSRSIEGAHLSYRLALLDPATGQQLARRILDSDAGRPRVAPAGAGRLWLHSRRQLRLLDTRTLADLVTHKQLVQAVPALADGLRGSVLVDGWSGGAIVTTHKGEMLLVDSRKLKARAFRRPAMVLRYRRRELLMDAVQAARLAPPLLPGQLHRGSHSMSLRRPRLLSAGQQRALDAIGAIERIGRSTSGTTSSYYANQQSYRFASQGGSPKMALLHRCRGCAAPTADGTGDALLNPRMLTRANTRAALLLPGGRGLVVQHQDTLDNKQAKSLFSGLSLQGKRRWTLTDVLGQTQGTFVVGRELVIAVRAAGDRPSYLLALDWSSGKRSWRQEL